MKNPYLTQSFFVKSFKFDKAIIFLYKSYKAKIREYKKLFFALRISYQSQKKKKSYKKKNKSILKRAEKMHTLKMWRHYTVISCYDITISYHYDVTLHDGAVLLQFPVVVFVDALNIDHVPALYWGHVLLDVDVSPFVEQHVR